MATYIKTLKEDNGDITYPQTKAGAVLLDNGSDLETELSQFVTAEDIASTSALTPPVQTNMIADGAVTSAKIDWTTFTPTQGTATINSTYLTGTVYYQKIGRLVKVIFSNLATKTAPPNSSGTTAISGLPQSASNMATELFLLKSFTSTGKYLRLGMTASSTTMYFHWSNGTGTATEMDGQFFYFAA